MASGHGHELMRGDVDLMNREGGGERCRKPPTTLILRACESLEGGASDERRLIDDANYAIASRGRRGQVSGTYFHAIAAGQGGAS